ncbi:hypothetical protein [Streptomyces griseoluteus]
MISPAGGRVGRQPWQAGRDHPRAGDGIIAALLPTTRRDDSPGATTDR